MVAFIAVHLWQSTLLLIAAWVLALACRRNAAAIRYWVWFAASAKFLVPLALLQQLGDYLGRSLPEPLPVNPSLVDTANAMFVLPVARSVGIADGMPSQIAAVVVAVWTLGAALLCLRWIAQWRSIRSMLASAPQIYLDLPAPVRITSGDLTTGVFGIFRPIVILPGQLMRALSAKQLNAVLAHEACHIRRRDNLTAAIHRCVEVIFWFYPPVWWIGANLLRERETACDESVIEEGHEPVIYAESILSACRLGVTAQFPGVAASTGGNLTQRLSSIMSEQRAQPISRARFAVLFVTAILVCFAPIAAGIASGAIREASDAGPVTFDAIVLKPSEPGSWRSAHFDADAGRIVLKNFSLRHLISSAYPSSTVNGEPETIDRIRYDIEAQWREHGGTSERNLYRELLKQVLQTNSNLELYVTEI
jgi:beta-lactamase regulating signal transducer with metallopeptidase domain